MHIPAHPRYRSRRLLALAAAGGLTLAAACGGDDDSAGGSTASTPAVTATAAAAATGDLDAYCADEVALDLVFSTADPADGAAFQAALAAAEPIVDRLLAGAPADLADHFTVLGAAYDDVVASGDPSAFFGDDVAAADEAVHAYDLEHCGWTTVDITAADYHFAGDFPTTAGTINLQVTNDGAEPHVLVLARKHDDVAESALDAFAALDGETDFPNSFDEVTQVFAGPGTSDYALADLVPGSYVAFCPIPEGSSEDGEGAGPPHFTMGMVTAFAVA